MINQISTKTRFGWISAFENHGKIFKVKFGRLKKQKKSKTLEIFKKTLLNFFNKKNLKIKIPYKMQGNKIQIKVWKELRKIKIGHTLSYGKIAKKFKLSPRYIGKICSQNSLLLIVPCHRVIRTDGALGGFSSLGGVKVKRKLLEFEKTLVV